MSRFPSIHLVMNSTWLGGCLWLSVLVIDCAGKPEITRDFVVSSITDPKTGKVNAGDLGWAMLNDLRIETPEIEGNRATVLARVKAEQDKLGVLYKLSASLRLHFEWENRTWDAQEARRGPALGCQRTKRAKALHSGNGRRRRLRGNPGTPESQEGQPAADRRYPVRAVMTRP